jgi:hypothetical protein
MGDTGHEHHPLALLETAISENASAKSDAHDPRRPKIGLASCLAFLHRQDPNLAQIIWA